MENYKTKIVGDLQNLGLQKAGVILVHSSLRSLGPIPDKANLVIESLLEVLGEEGTLLMPALSYETVSKKNPYFDVNKTPSCVGALTEFFRKKEGVIRSVHPTHSVCGIGNLAEAVLQDHSIDQTPCGPNSPFRKLKEVNGKILFIGCGLRPNTSMHAVEELVEPPYLFGEEVIFNITSKNKNLPPIKMRTHDFVGWKQRYDRVENILSPEELKKGKVLDAESFLIEAPAMWKKAYEILKQDPFYFVDQIF
ncbi:AAC(3)-VI family aminoglycoside N-acetyltransferase [soil metagenome]|jgi:aminoglycoside 3-N-acetyltransferase